MTFENSKRLYDHFLAVGNEKAASELLNKHPQIGVKEEEEKPEKVPSTKEKSKKND